MPDTDMSEQIVNLLDQYGNPVGQTALARTFFGVKPHVSVMHQVVNAQLAASRRGTHNTATRAEVAGGGAKPWRQKGTGRARHGSIRSPQWRGGGVAHGPKPRSYCERTPKKMKNLALVSALSDRAQSGSVVVVDKWSFEEPSTKQAFQALQSVGVSGKVLVILGKEDAVAWKSFRNLPKAHCLLADQLNTYDVLNSDFVLFTKATLPTDGATSESSGDNSE